MCCFRQRPAAKAVEGLGLRIDEKGRGLFRMKRAQTGQIPPLFLERDIAGNDLLDVAVLFELLDE